MLNNYSPIVFSHYRSPRNFGKLKKTTQSAEELNPLCGDEVKVYLRISHGAINNISHETRGCALTVAAASVLTERIMNREIRITDLKKIDKPEIEKMLGIKVGPARESCITLALKAIKKIII